MNVLHISASHEEKNQHAFSFHFKQTCKQMGISIISISPYNGELVGIIEDELKEPFIDYYIGKKIFPLSKLLEKYEYFDTDFIFIENPKWSFDNDTEVDVVYYHRDLVSKLYVRNPDYLPLRFWTSGIAKDGRPAGGLPEIIEIWHPEIWWDKSIKKFPFYNAVDPDEFKKFENISRNQKGFAYYGSYLPVSEMMKYNSTHYRVYKHHYDIIKYIEKHNLASEFREVNESFEEYKYHLRRFEGTVIIPAWDSWETRRLYEASINRCVPILYIQNHIARDIFEKQGYIHGETCITFENCQELADLDLNDYNLESIRKKGQRLVRKRHTYKSRILQLCEEIDIFKKMEEKGKTEEMEDRIIL